MLLALWEYHTWANERILAAAAALPPKALLQPLASGHDTLLGTLWHVVGAAETWRVRAETGQDPVEASDYGAPDLGVLAAHARVVEYATQADPPPNI